MFTKQVQIFPNSMRYSLSILYAINPLTIYNFAELISGFYNVYIIVPLILSMIIRVSQSKENNDNYFYLLISNLCFFFFYNHIGHIASILLVQFLVLSFYYCVSYINIKKFFIIFLLIILGQLPNLIFIFPQIIEQFTNFNSTTIKNDFIATGISVSKFFSISPHSHGMSWDKILGLYFFICFLGSAIYILKKSFFFSFLTRKVANISFNITGTYNFTDKNYKLGKKKSIYKEIALYQNKKTKFFVINMLSVYMLVILGFFLLNFSFFDLIRNFTIDQVYIFMPLRTYDKLFLYIPFFLIIIIGINSLKWFGKYYCNFIIISISIFSILICYEKKNSEIYLSQYPAKTYSPVSEDIKEANRFIQYYKFKEHILILPAARINKNFIGWVELPEIFMFGLHPLSSHSTKFLLIENQYRFMNTNNFIFLNQLLNSVFSKNKSKSGILEKFNYVLIDKLSSMSNLENIN
ncbi:hypothetical protein OAM56_09350, partial [Alphaproteobacteria bacterium]|nr:hypothetical protein [Alphaproteobacteria bacterium]